MTHTEFSNLLDRYLEGTLEDAQALQMREHADHCEECAGLLTLRQDLLAMDQDEEVPGSFSFAWRQAVREEEKTMETEKNEKKQLRRPWINRAQGYLAAAAVLAFLVGGTALSRGSLPTGAAPAQSALNTSAPNPAAYMTRTAEMDMAESASYDSAAGGGNVALMKNSADTGAVQETKIVINASMTLKTADYDEDLAALQALTAQYGGLVESLSASGDSAGGENRRAYLTLRVPSGQVQEFIAGARGVAEVTNFSQSQTDISESYYDIAGRLSTQQEKLKRLNALMEKAESVTDLVEIESAISDTQYSIDYYTGQINHFDSQVSMSQVDVTLREVKIAQTQEATLLQRVGQGLETSLAGGLSFLKDMCVFLVMALPWLLVVGAAAFITLRVVKGSRKKKNAKE